MQILKRFWSWLWNKQPKIEQLPPSIKEQFPSIKEQLPLSENADSFLTEAEKQDILQDLTEAERQDILQEFSVILEKIDNPQYAAVEEYFESRPKQRYRSASLLLAKGQRVGCLKRDANPDPKEGMAKHTTSIYKKMQEEMQEAISMTTDEATELITKLVNETFPIKEKKVIKKKPAKSKKKSVRK